MSDEHQDSERQGGWLSQLMRARHRSPGPDITAGKGSPTQSTHAPQPEPAFELVSLCNYGERSEPELQVDDEALQTLCFQPDLANPGNPNPVADPVDRQDCRRDSRRVTVPANFYHVGCDEQFRPIEASIIMPPQYSRRIVSCFLFDVNDGGAAFVANEEIAAGTPVTLCLAHPENATPLIAAETVILHNKPLAPGCKIPEHYAGKQLWLHGVSLSERDSLVIYKATLDSLALNAAAGSSRHDN